MDTSPDRWQDTLGPVTPIHYSWDRRDRLSVISAITLSPQRRCIGLYFDIHDHNINTGAFELFVRWMRRQIRRGIILVMDRWSVHRSGARRLVDRFGSKVCVEWLLLRAARLSAFSPSPPPRPLIRRT